MRQIIIVVSFLIVVGALISCGKINENFSRLHQDYTLVKFRPDRGALVPASTQNGAVFFYLMNQSAGAGGAVVGFPNEDVANSAATAEVAIPNGSYKVFALGFAGPTPGGGQARCGYGNGGATVNLNGGSVNIPIAISTAGCGFGAASDFGFASNSPGGTNFYSWEVNLCTNNNPSLGCSPATGSSLSVNVTMMGGYGGPNTTVNEIPAWEQTSTCVGASNGVFSFAANLLNLPVPPNFTLPVKINVFSGATCAASGSLLRTFSFTDGMKNFVGAASSSTTYISFATSSGTQVRLYKDF